MKITPTNQWSYSQNEEYWDNDFFPSKEEAIEAGKEWYLGESFEVGQMYDVEFTQDDCEWLDIAEHTVDKLIDSLYDEVGEVSEEDAYRERCNLIQYKQSNIVTLQAIVQMAVGMPVNSKFIKRELSLRLLDAVEENMKIECINTPEKDMIEYRGVLRVVKVE